MIGSIISQGIGALTKQVPKLQQGKTERIGNVRGWAAPIIYLLCALPFVILLWSWMVISMYLPQYQSISDEATNIVNTIGAKFFFSIISGLLFGSVGAGAILAKSKIKSDEVKHKREMDVIEKVAKKKIDFDYAFDKVMGHEGGYVNHKDDKGGETFRGIAREYHGKWRGWKYVDRYKSRVNGKKKMMECTKLNALVKRFYETEFWEKAKCDQIIKLSPDLAIEHFDLSVNAGIFGAAKILQKTINLCSKGINDDIIVDGKIGTKTIEFLDILLPKYEKAVVIGYNYYQADHYVKICEKNPSQYVFIRGWLARV